MRFLTIVFLLTFSHVHADMITFLYQHKVGSIIRPVFTRTWFNYLAGFWADRWVSKFFIKSFVTQNNINMDEAIRKKPGQYSNFNDFFTRSLEPSARPICPESKSICAPADGTMYVIENIQENTEFVVKGSTFNLTQFLHDKQLATSFCGGTLVLIYLSPADYHRFHAPFQGLIQDAPRHIKGKYESVNPSVFTQLQPLTENERQLLLLSDHNARQVALVAVGALCVGRISFTYPTVEIAKGQELGYFGFGGSTIVLLFPPDTITIAREIGNEQKIKMGQCIGYFKS